MSRVLSMALIPQYRRLIRTSKGAEQRDREFLIRKSVGLRVRSERNAMMKVRYATVRPRMVRL